MSWMAYSLLKYKRIQWDYVYVHFAVSIKLLTYIVYIELAMAENQDLLGSYVYVWLES